MAFELSDSCNMCSFRKLNNHSPKERNQQT